MITKLCLLIVLALELSSQPMQSGWASYYDKQPTDLTIIARIDMNDIPAKKLDVYIAVADCKRIGEHGLITINDSAPLRYVVFDCAGRDAHADGVFWMDAKNIIVELDYYATETYAPCRCGTWVELYPYKFRITKNRSK